MIFRFGKDGISGISPLATEAPAEYETPGDAISSISNFSNASEIGDREKEDTYIYIKSSDPEGAQVANQLIPLIEDRNSLDTADQQRQSNDRKRLTELLTQATDGLRFIELGKHPLSGQRMTAAMFAKQLTRDDAKGIIDGDYDGKLLRCAAESMARFPSEFALREESDEQGSDK